VREADEDPYDQELHHSPELDYIPTRSQKLR
jgi:hypothetical protein